MTMSSNRAPVRAGTVAVALTLVALSFVVIDTGHGAFASSGCAEINRWSGQTPTSTGFQGDFSTRDRLVFTFSVLKPSRGGTYSFMGSLCAHKNERSCKGTSGTHKKIARVWVRAGGWGKVDVFNKVSGIGGYQVTVHCIATRRPHVQH